MASQASAEAVSWAGTAPEAKAARRRRPRERPCPRAGPASRPGAPGPGPRCRSARPAAVGWTSRAVRSLRGRPRQARARPCRPPRSPRPCTPEASGSLARPAAAAPPEVSARKAATASSMRSRWASALTSRPITRSTTSMTISPIRDAASSTARWRAKAISTSGVAHNAVVLALPACLRVRADLLGGAVCRGHDLAGLLARLLRGRTGARRRPPRHRRAPGRPHRAQYGSSPGALSSPC